LSEANAQGRVLAPADGRVTRAPIPQGAVVMPGEVVVAIATGARVLRLELPEAQAAFLREGQDIRILDAGGDDRALSVRVRQVYPAIEDGRVTADLDAQTLAGEFVGARVRVLIPAGERETIIIPGAYIVTRYGLDYVRLVRDGAVIDAPVQRGAATPTEALPDGIEILSGLAPGDVIVTPERRV
jgi:multidrug efflux pump subunit AcrA (membrane-fusion protein)